MGSGWPLGLVAGLMLASPVGFVVGLLIWILKRPRHAVVVACLCQFSGLLILGLGFRDPSAGDEVGWAMCGQILGAVAGVVVALAWPATLRLRPTQCRQCGYELHGNVSGVCPECGTKIADDQLELIRDSSSPRWSNKDDEESNR
jgi:hypothetical protein